MRSNFKFAKETNSEFLCYINVNLSGKKWYECCNILRRQWVTLVNWINFLWSWLGIVSVTACNLSTSSERETQRSVKLSTFRRLHNILDNTEAVAPRRACSNEKLLKFPSWNLLAFILNLHWPLQLISGTKRRARKEINWLTLNYATIMIPCYFFGNREGWLNLQDARKKFLDVVVLSFRFSFVVQEDKINPF